MNRRLLATSLTGVLLLALGVAQFLTRDSTVAPPALSSMAPPPVARGAQLGSAARGEARAPAADVASSTPRTAPAVCSPPPPIAPAPLTTGSTVTATSDRDTSGTPYDFDKEGIGAAIHEKMPEIRECADAWLRQNPKLEGRMLVAFDITPDDAGTGEVTRIELVDGGVGQPFMEGCILNAFQDIRFVEPPGGGKVRVRYPIRVEGGQGGASMP